MLLRQTEALIMVGSKHANNLAQDLSTPDLVSFSGRDTSSLLSSESFLFIDVRATALDLRHWAVLWSS